MTNTNFEYIGKKYTSGGLDTDNFIVLEYDEYYRLQNVEELPLFLTRLAPVGRLIRETPPLRVQSSTVKRISEPLADGSVTVTVHISCSTRYDTLETDVFGNPVSENTPPWFLRPTEFRIVSATQEESVKCVWPGVSSITSYGGFRIEFLSKDDPVPFMNSAGELLDATVSRGLAQMSFSYNLQYVNPNATWLYCFKTNKYNTVICDLDFPERTVLIQNISMDKKCDYNNNGSVRWTYYKVQIQLLLDPDTFNKDYHNVGSHIKDGGGLAKLWRWNRGRSYGSLADYYESQYTDGEEIPGLMYLNKNGDSISGFDGQGNQIPVYLNGCIFEPIDFISLNLPRVR
ncbi:MAG: hypothetical protein PHQ75_08700 [Thermoguttaceae bacterium]|nr:hypothetical protein [Thermoguttaceae bacterium]